MRKLTIAIGSISLFLPMIAMATGPTNNGSMGVNCTVASSIGITISTDTGNTGFTLTNSGSDTTTATLGTIRAYGAGTTGLTRTLSGETSTTYATHFLVRVVKANSTSSNYTLAAQLGAAATSHTVLIDAVDISDGTSQTIGAGTDAYSSDVSHTVNLVFLHSQTTGLTVSDAITFTVTAN